MLILGLGIRRRAGSAGAVSTMTRSRGRLRTLTSLTITIQCRSVRSCRRIRRGFGIRIACATGSVVAGRRLATWVTRFRSGGDGLLDGVRGSVVASGWRGGAFGFAGGPIVAYLPCARFLSPRSVPTPGGLRMLGDRPRECRWGVELKDRVDVRRAYAFLLSVRAVSRELGISESAVRAAIAPGARTRYVRRASEATIARASDPQIRAMLERHPRISIDAAMRELGWVRSRSALARRLRELRPEYAGRAAVPRVRTGPIRGGDDRGEDA